MARHGFWLLAAAHLALWTLLPAATQPNLPLDAVEMLYFGREWELGYYKHPPLAAWLAETAYQLSGRAAWSLYLLAQVAVIASFGAVWRLGRCWRAPGGALLGVLLLEACWFYNYASTEFNNNVAMYPFWAWTVLFFLRALEQNRRRDWLGCGVALGLGLLAKYTTVLLAVTMLALLVVHPRGRRTWRTAGPCLLGLTAAALFAPHLAWALGHGLSPVTFALERTAGAGRLVDHLLSPLLFLAKQAVALAPLVLAAVPLLGGHFRLRTVDPDERFRRDSLAWLVLGPAALSLLASAALGLSLRAAYGSQLWIFAGALLLMTLRIEWRTQAARRAVAVCGLVAVLLAAVAAGRSLGGPHWRGKASRIHFPGRQLAAAVERQWGRDSDAPLPLVGGEWWLAGNVAAYAASRPSVYGGSGPDMLDPAPRYSAWASDARLRASGGILLWNLAHSDARSIRALRARFPQAQPLPVLRLRWQTAADLPPLRIGGLLVRPRRTVRGPS